MDKQDSDYAINPVPMHARKGLLSSCVVLIGFTFFTATMFAGGKIGLSFDFKTMLWAATIGNLLLGFYAAALGFIASKTGLSAVLMTRYSFGNYGSKVSDFLLGFTQIGWYAWGTATIAIVLIKMLGLSSSWETPLMILFGFGFCLTAYIGYKGLDLLSRISIPIMLAVLLASLFFAVQKAGGLSELAHIVPSETMTLSTAITLVFGTFVSGAIQATNWTRFAKSGKVAVWASLSAFFIGNGLMIITGAIGAIVYKQPDIVEVLVLQGLSVAAVVMLFLNIWTTQDNTIYNFAAAGCNMLRTKNRKAVTLGGAAIGTLLAIAGMSDFLIPFLLILGVIIPPLGGVILADFFIVYKGRYPTLEEADKKLFNIPGLLAYVAGAAAAYLSPWLSPIVGILVAFALHPIFMKWQQSMQKNPQLQIEKAI